MLHPGNHRLARRVGIPRPAVRPAALLRSAVRHGRRSGFCPSRKRSAVVFHTHAAGQCGPAFSYSTLLVCSLTCLQSWLWLRSFLERTFVGGRLLARRSQPPLDTFLPGSVRGGMPLLSATSRRHPCWDRRAGHRWRRARRQRHTASGCSGEQSGHPGSAHIYPH